MSRPPVATGDRPSTHDSIMCYECGQTGHIKLDCPKLKGSVRVAAIHTEDVHDEGRNMEIEQEAPNEYQGEEQDDEYHPVTTQSVEESTDKWVEEPSQYNWDDNDRKSDSGSTTTYRSSAVCIPDFTCAMGMKTFTLAQPIALQLACIGSCSTINYGTRATIKFGDHDIKEHFDVTNVEYHDVILGIPFLKQLGICLDFRNPACILIGNKEVPTNEELILGVPMVERKRNRPKKLVDETVNE